MSIVAVHGIGNRFDDTDNLGAAAVLAQRWTTKLAAGFRDAGLPGTPPRVSAAYYAYLLDDDPPGAGDPLAQLTPEEQQWARLWMREAGVPAEDLPGPPPYPLHQGLDRIAQRWNREARATGRLMAAFLREVRVYRTRPGVRARCQAAVIDAVDTTGARVVVAHSLGSVVAYEALCARPDRRIDLFVTLGSPLGLPGAVFDALLPEPAGGRAARPAGVRRWVNIADPGDLLALPKNLGDHFGVDEHTEVHLGTAGSHTLGGYLSCGLTALAIAPGIDGGS